MKAEIKIHGTTCAMCVKAVEKSLKQLPGVAEARVNLGNETATVEYDASRLKFAEVEKAIADAGYQVVDEKTAVKVAA